MARTIVRSLNPQHYEWLDNAYVALFEGFRDAFRLLCRGRGPMFYDILYTSSGKLNDFRAYRWSDRPERILIYPENPSNSSQLLEEERILVVQLRPEAEDVTTIMEYAGRIAMMRALDEAPLSRHSRVEIEIWKGVMSDLKKREGEEIRNGCVNFRS